MAQDIETMKGEYCSIFDDLYHTVENPRGKMSMGAELIKLQTAAVQFELNITKLTE